MTIQNRQKEEILNYFKLLRIDLFKDAFFEIRSFFPDGAPCSTFVTSDYDYVDFIENLKLEGHKNIFVGINPRGARSGKSDAVWYLVNFVLDLDEIKDRSFLIQEFKDNIIIDSGRGLHIYFPLHPIELTLENRQLLLDKSKQITDNFRLKLKDVCKVDHVFDFSRVMRCPGTINPKNENICYIVNYKEDFKVFNFNDLYSSVKDINKSEPVASIKSNIDLYVDGETIKTASFLCNEKSSSEALYYFATKLMEKGLKQKEINYLWEKTGLGTKGKSYFNDIQRIFNKIEEKLEIKSLNLFWNSYKLNLNKRELGFMSGFPSLDAKTGGFRRKELTIVGGGSSHGKTTFAINLIDEFLLKNLKVLMFPTEMNFVSLIDKLISARCGIPLFKFRKNELSENDLKEVADIEQDLKNLNFVVSEISSPNLAEVRHCVTNVMPDIFILDYVQRVSTKRDDRQGDLEDFTRGIKNIAKESNCHAIMTSQLNRLADEKCPDIKTLRDTSSLEHEGDLVLLIGTENKLDQERLLHLYVAKNRFGELGYIPLIFNTKNGIIKEKRT